jgi:dimethylsulfide dehydrogenase subunit gamma/complex iron-sulfur molybdoenzyme family reductase subunit gamma
MKPARWLPALLLLVAGGALAAPPELDLLRQAGRIMDAGAAAEMPPLSPGDPAWGEAPATLLRIYPQRSTAPNFEEVAPATLKVQALAGKGHLALRLAWADKSEDRLDPKRTDRFADAVAVQFPARPGRLLPYVGMGEPNNPVSLWFWRAGTVPELAEARGFGSLTALPGAGPEVDAVHGAGEWTVVLRAPLAAHAGSPLPVAFAVWDGAAQGRDGRKWLSSWQVLRLPGVRDDRARLRAFAAESFTVGNAMRGEKLAAERGCSACHRLPEGPAFDTGPALLNAGGIHWPGYLRRSILQASSFVVPGRSYGANGISLMPDQEWRGTEVEDLVAYLTSLK